MCKLFGCNTVIRYSISKFITLDEMLESFCGKCGFMATYGKYTTMSRKNVSICPYIGEECTLVSYI